MQRITVILCIIIIPIAFVLAYWENTYGGVYDEYICSLAITNQNYIMSGATYSFSYELPDFYLIKVRSSGLELWQRIYGYGCGYSVINADDEGYIAAGYLIFPPITDKHCYLMKTDEDGDSIWAYIYRIGNARAASVAQTFDGGYIVAWDIPVSGEGFYLVKTDSLGDSIWTRTYADTVVHNFRSLVRTPDEGCIAVGEIHLEGHSDVSIARIDSLGEIIWTQNYGSHGTDYACFIDTTADGNFIITGRTSIYTTGSIVDLYLLKINPLGDTLWTRQFGGVDNIERGYCVRQTFDGGYIVVGETYSYGIGTPDSSNVYLIKTDSEGNMEWECTYGGNGQDYGTSVSQTDDGGYIIAGVYDQGPHTDVYLIKTDSLGNVDWIREPGRKPQEIVLNVYPNPFNDVCRITVDVGAWRAMPLQIEIFDLRGNLIETFDKTPCVWKPDDEIGSGMYLVRATTGEKMVSKKTVLMR